MKRQVSSAKSVGTRSSFGSSTGLSPYEKNYKGCLRMEQRELIFEHQRVSKMTRRDLEDQHINLLDEHYAIRRENRFNQEKIKRLITKISRISSLSLSDLRASLNAALMNRPRDLLSFEEKLQVCIFDLEVQNSQLNERLQTLCKRNGHPAPPGLPRPASDMYSHHCGQPEQAANRLRARARSCNHINGIPTDRSKEDIPDDKGPLEYHSHHHQLPETVPVKLVDENAEKIKDLEEKNERLGKLLSDFNEQLEQERGQNKEISYKLKELEIRKHISENIELINVKEKLDQAKNEFKKRIEHLEISKERNEKIRIEERLKLVEITQKLNEEEDKSKKLASQLKQIEGFKKQIDDLREQLIESESEKQSLKTQQERFALLLKESVHQGDRIQTLKDKNTFLESQLDEAKANEMAVTHSKTELVEKIIKIQDESDRISIELEGLRSLLAQDNEYKIRKQVESKHIEKKFNLQDVGLNGDQGEMKSTPQASAKQTFTKSPKKTTKQKSVGINTDPVHITKETGRPSKVKDRKDSSEAQSSVSSGDNSTVENNQSYYDEPLTMDSERSSLIHFARTMRPQVPKFSSHKPIPQENYLELLERAALYESYPGSTGNYKPPYESLDDQSISLLSPVKHKPTENNYPQLLINLLSFTFEQSPSKDNTYHLEITVTPDQSFHTTAFNECDLNYQKSIKVGCELLKCLTGSKDQVIRFLLLEKETPAPSQSPPSSISSSTREETLTMSTNIVQCHEIAYGSLRYSELFKSIAEAKSDRCTVLYEIPFHATKFSHPEIGRLTVRFLIDGILRIRQLLTNATQQQEP